MRPITDWCKHKALIFDSSGRLLGMKRISWKKRTFDFENRLYNFLPDNSTFFKIRRLFSTTKYYLYNFDDPNPIVLNGINQPVVDSEAYKIVLETDLIKKLNDIHSFNILAFLTQPKVIIVILVIIGLIWYFSSGQTPSEVVDYVSGRGS